jgi:hypothetical protein
MKIETQNILGKFSGKSFSIIPEKDQEDLRMMEAYMDANGIKYEPQLKKLGDALKMQCVNENPNKFA